MTHTHLYCRTTELHGSELHWRIHIARLKCCQGQECRIDTIRLLCIRHDNIEVLDSRDTCADVINIRVLSLDSRLCELWTAILFVQRSNVTNVSGYDPLWCRSNHESGPHYRSQHIQVTSAKVWLVTPSTAHLRTHWDILRELDRKLLSW